MHISVILPFFCSCLWPNSIIYSDLLRREKSQTWSPTFSAVGVMEFEHYRTQAYETNKNESRFESGTAQLCFSAVVSVVATRPVVLDTSYHSLSDSRLTSVYRPNLHTCWTPSWHRQAHSSTTQP